MHINYCEQGQSLERIFQVATKIGYDGVEFRRYQKMYGLEPEAYLEKIAELKYRYHLPYTFFGGPGIDTEKDNWEESLEGYLKFLEKGKELGVLSTINIMVYHATDPNVPTDLQHCDAHGYPLREEELWDRTVKVCRIVADAAPEAKFAFETHMFYIHDTSKSARILVDAIDRPNFGINLDYGNALFYAKTEPLEEAIDIAGEKLFYTHMKSYQPLGIGTGILLPTSLADGCINHRNYVAKLKSIGYTGPIGIEAPRPGDREHFAAEDFTYIQPIIREA